MKNLINRLAFIAAFVCLGVCFNSCEEEQLNGDFSVAIKNVAADYVELSFTAAGSMEVAYLLSETEKTGVLPAVIFNSGKTLTVKDGDVVKISDGVAAETKYYLYVVAKIDASSYSEVTSLEFTTAAYEFKDVITIVDTYYDGFKAFVNVPDETIQRGNVLRYVMSDLAVHNKSKNLYQEPDWYNLLFNGGHGADITYGIKGAGYMTKDTTIVYNNDNQMYLDANGKPILDSNNEYLLYHEPVVPGQPTVFMVGEFAYGNIMDSGTMYAFHPTYENPMNYGYLLPQFSFDINDWTGTFEKKKFLVNMPEELDCNVDIEISDISPIDATVTIIPDDNVYHYVYWVLPLETYNSAMSLIETEDNLQWFITSYTAFMEGATVEDEAIQFNAASMFYEPLSEQSKFYLLVTAMGKDENGNLDASKQKFFKTEFRTAAKTKSAPKVVVTACEPDPAYPYLATFNLKAPDKDVAGGTYACNYVRDFIMETNTYPDKDKAYEELLYNQFNTYGIKFSSEELKKINSDEGYTMSFYTLDGETTRFVAYCCNDEYTFNKIDVKDDECTAFADFEAPYVPADPFIASDLYEVLEGVWTASATLNASEADEEGNVSKYKLDHKTKVEISYGAPEYPETLPQSVYDIYAGLSSPVSKNRVDDMYEEFKILSQQFGENRVINQNRLLMTGFLDFDYYQDPGRLDTMSPYDLFCDVTYNSVDIPQMFYDFGPKWYLEVLEDGTVIAPFDSSMLPPMSNWGSYPMYLGGYDAESMYAFYNSNETIKGFPVEISEDRNTITIKPIVIDGISYYPNSIIVSGYNSFEIVAPVVSEIVLTRGWDEPQAASAAYVQEASKAQVRNIDGSPAQQPELKTIKSMTEFQKYEPKQYKIVEKPNFISLETFNAGMEKAVEVKLGIKLND